MTLLRVSRCRGRTSGGYPMTSLRTTSGSCERSLDIDRWPPRIEGTLAGRFLRLGSARRRPLGGPGPLQPNGAVDDTEVAVGLREVTARRAGDRIVPLREQPQRRGECDELPQLALRGVEAVQADQALHVPEAGQQERGAEVALVVLAVVTPDVG